MSVTPLDLKVDRRGLRAQDESRRIRIRKLEEGPICYLSNDEQIELLRLREERRQIHNELLRRPQLSE